MNSARRIRRSARTFHAAAALLAALLTAACDDGIGLLTMDERQALYRAEVSGKGSALAVSAENPGAILDPTEGIRVSFETLRGSEEPSEFLVTLRDAPGTYTAAVRYRTGASPSSEGAEGSAPREIRVPTLGSFSGTFEVPPEFPDGYYELTMDARSAREESLSYSAIGLFLVRGSLPAPSILSYPPNPVPGARVLLVADLAGYEGRDPYLRWTVDGAVRAEGPASRGMDKLLWPAPPAGSAAPVGLALYPTAPPPGVAYSFPPPRGASASLLVAPGTPVSQDEFTRPERFRALFRMEDTPDYEGVPGGEASFLGTPRLDVHPGGFGLILGGDAGAGIRAPALLLPVREGRLQPCTILVRLVPSKSVGGVLFRAGSGSSDPVLEIRVVEGRPVAVLRTGDKAGELAAGTLLTPGRPVLLGVTLRPAGSSLEVGFLADGLPAGGGILRFGAEGWGPEGVTTVAGPGGFEGLYEDVGVWAFDELDRPGVFPAFRYASRRALGTSLLLAEGFEGAYGEPPVLEGGASADSGEGLRLPAGATARFPADLDGSFDVEASLASGTAPVLVLSGPEGSFRMAWNPGEAGVDPGTGLPLLRAQFRPSGEGGGLRVLGWPSEIRVSGPGPWTLSLEGAGPGVSGIRSIRAFRSGRTPGD